MADNLVEHVREELARQLPTDPSKAIIGTELVKMIIGKLPKGTKGSTVRQYFSNLQKESNPVIAKVDGHIGFYRPSNESSRDSEVDGSDMGRSQDTGYNPRDTQREEKFRAVFRRYTEVIDRDHTMHVEHTTGAKRERGLDKWKYPDVVVLKWLLEVRGGKLDPHILQIKRSLGEPPFEVTSVELKASVTKADARMAFFQCLSNSRWAHGAVLAIATAIDDEVLADQLRKLGTVYGVEVRTYGFSTDALDSLVNAGDILSMSNDVFESRVAKQIVLRTLVPGRKQESLDWHYLQEMQQVCPAFGYLLRWIAMCLENSKALTLDAVRTVVDTLD